MGTSSSYCGPTGNNPLLPPWANEPPLNNPPPPLIPIPNPEPPLVPEPPPNPDIVPTNEPSPNNELPSVVCGVPSIMPIPVNPTISWRSPKAMVSQLARGSTSRELAKVFRSYTRARGGSSTSAQTSRSGISSTAALGSFLSQGIRQGFTQAAQNLGLQNFIGRDAQFVLASFIDLLAPEGSQLEEAIARKAMIETMSEMFQRYDVENRGLEALNSINADGMQEIITLSIVNYINERVQQELVNCIERGSCSEREANNLIGEMKDFIVGVVKIDFEDINLLTLDWNAPETINRVEEVYKTAYSLLESVK